MDALKAKISDDAPMGIYLKGDRAAYRALRNAFNGGQTAYRALSETAESLLDRELQAADVAAWGRLEEEAGQCLRDKSKDLEIFCWYVAARIHLKGALENTAAALGALTDLVETDWDALHPIPPEDKLGASDDAGRKKEIDAGKLRVFLQLVGEVPGGGLLSLPLTNMPLFGDVTYGAMLSAEKGEGITSLSGAMAAAVGGDAIGLTARIEALQALLAHANRLNAALRPIAGSCGETPVPVSHLTKQIEDILRLLRQLTDGAGLPWPGSEAPEETPAEQDTAPAPQEASADTPTAPHAAAGFAIPVGAPENREAALDALAELARYFRRTEPQSPIHLMLDRAVRWGRMSIVELYAELLGEGSDSFNRMSVMTGVESYDYTGKTGRPKPAKRADLPELSRYDAPPQVTPPVRMPDPEPVPEITPSVSEETASDAAPADPETETKDLPMRSFEW
ncbi:ImpA family type VI secretion system protein [Donghicola mangrovi]|uniref:ImpA N-terminal domain-containing protein n=1 Tax=Donghicola mangrovi TaxID=2729614 RepID=A0A850Q7Q6_9RHOB|nr:type VI secretion system ImpA family N-terminal domain-containing protein [Donghicola mangrovi]NVO23028.1 hypothetical protein [Donghicola mangrovi]